MFDFEGWRKAFLAHRNLTRPNGEMLFAYRASKDEYLDLRAVLATKLAHLSGESWIFGSAAECACFVLYAAEWWHREYAGGAWRWTHILESIWPTFNVDVLERTYAVERGLRAWGHLPSGAGKRYLGAIVAHGGLPLQLVAKGDGAIIKLLIRGTRQAQLFAWDSVRLEGFFAAHEQDLVQHLRNDDIYRLLASVVLTVLALRHECVLAGVSNPVDVLDRTQPNWRERFPMAVDDSSAEPLLVGLVQEAAREVKAVVMYPVVASRSLLARADDAIFELALALEMPSSMSLAALAGACGMSPDALPQAFSLEAIGASRLPLGDGRQLLGGSDTAVVLTGRTKRIIGNAALHEQLLVLRGMGEDLHEAVGIPGADALDEAQPWVFAVRDTDLILAGLGSCRLADQRCLVAVAEGVDLVPDNSAAVTTLKGETEGLSPNRWIYEVSGSATVICDGDRYSIRTAQDVGATDQLVWKGRRAPYAARPLPVYQGVPQLCRLTVDGALIPVAARSLEWVMPTRLGARVDNPRMHRGPIDAWLVQDGIRQRRFRMALVSPEARIRFHSGDSEREGAIEFHGWGISSLAAPEALSRRQDIQPSLARLELACNARPPVTLGVSVCWPNSAHSLRLDLPFPSTGGRFAGQTGAALAAGLALPLRRLREIRAQVFDRNPDAPKRYTLIMELVGGSSRLVAEHAIPIDRQGFGELRLLELETSVQGLMCQSNALDARVDLRICLGQSPIATMRLTRYDADLERRALAMAVSDDCLARLSPEELAGVKLRALPMLTAEAKEVELAQSCSSGVPVGRWELASLPASQGPWLVYPAADSTMQLRPTLYPGLAIGAQPAGATTHCPLAQSMALTDADERTRAIGQVVTHMSNDLDHVSWTLIIRQYQLLSHLPLSTLDYWRVIGRDMNAALAAVLRLSVDMTSLMTRMRDELGVIWELTPTATLSAGLGLLSTSWARPFKVEPQDPWVRTLVEPVFQSVGQVDPILGELVHLALFQAGFNRHEGLDRLIASVSAGGRAQLQQLWIGEGSLLQRFLLRTHAEDRIWPAFGLTKALLQALQQHAPDAADRLLKDFSRDLLWLPTAGQTGQYSKNMKEDVANAPLLAALLAQLCPSQSAWRTEQVMAQLRRIRSFDPGWFDVSCRAGTLVAIILIEQAQQPNRKSTAPSTARNASTHGHRTSSNPPAQVRRLPRAVDSAG